MNLQRVRRTCHVDLVDPRGYDATFMVSSIRSMALSIDDRVTYALILERGVGDCMRRWLDSSRPVAFG